ncbi:MAG: glycosyltransferase family 39 protein [Actinobacteria bacterium]|nr:glycosyltransferase family 39 protein [Actinomycetota bacterium]
MQGELTRKRTTLSGKTRSLMASLSWHKLALAAVLLLSAFLNLFRLTSLGYGNAYYAAAVKNMLTSWHNFFFVSFDAGFVSVDKPPLGLWIQAASAYLFGFNGLSLLLPQALAGILSVALLYHLVRRAFGAVAGLVAALVLAVTPVAVGVERTNNSDGLLVLTVLVAAWAVIRATETGRVRWLLVGAVIVGLGFNIKMLEAFLVLPAFYLLYFLAAPVSWWRRFVHLGLATAVLLVVSLSWAIAVDLTPADQRPYVGSSENNSALNLAFGYNGATRLLGRGEGAPGGSGQPAQENAQGDTPGSQGFGPGGGGPGGVGENGEPGPLRLLDEQLAGQIGWLLPLAVVGLLAASWQRRPRLPLDRRQGGLALWGMWLLTMGGFFSIAGMFHRYYMVMLAPAVAALVGVGIVALWNYYRSPGRRGWLLPLTLLGMAALHAYIILAYYDQGWSRWLTAVIVGLCLVAAVGLAFMRLRPGLKVSTYSMGAVAVSVLALLIAPTAWAAYTVWQGNGGGGGGLGGVGPRTAQASSWGGPPGGGPRGGGPPRGGPGGPDGEADPVLLEYLQANKGDATYLVAGPSSMLLSPIILGTDEPVIDLGGFMGRDPAVTPDELTSLVDEGAVRFFLVQDRERMEEMRQERMAEEEASGDDTSSGGGPGGAPQGPPPGGPPGMDNEAVTWVQDNCEKVPQEEWQSPETEEQDGRGPGGPGRAQALYDCDMGGQ